jgi:hypothetical protein
MESHDQADSRPSGAAFSAPWDVSYELHLVGSQMLSAIYACLHPVNLIVAASAWLVVSGVTGLLIGLVSGDAASGELAGWATADGWVVGSSSTGGTDVLLGLQTPYSAARLHLLPWWQLASSSGSGFWWQLLICLWGLVVWSWAVTVICRSTALRMLRVDFSWLDVFHFANRHFADAVFSILIPLSAVVVLALPLVLVGGMLAGDIVSLLGSLLVVLLGPVGLLTGLLLAGLTLSWPLMFPALAVEGRDSFESISRAYAYLLQRPVTLLGLALVGWIFGGIVIGVIDWFCYYSASSYEWGLSWGANALQSERFATILEPSEQDSQVLHLWTGPWVRMALAGFGLLSLAAQQAVFWGLSVAIYLLMRRALDQTPLDEIYQPGRSMLKPLA